MNYSSIFLQEKWADFSGYVYYKLLNNKYYLDLPRSININVEFNKKSKTYLAFAPQYQGLCTVASNETELKDMVNDAIYTYFGVPRYIARQLPNLFNPEGEGKQIHFVSNSTAVLA